LNPNFVSRQSWTQRIAAAFDAVRHRLLGGQMPATATNDPASALYRRTRLRLTLWYASVLAVVLLVAGVLLYVVMWQTVMGPVNGVLTSAGNDLATQWQQTREPPCFPTHDHFDENIAFVACYNSDVTAYLSVGGPASQAPGFLNPTLAKQALKSGSDSDTVDGGAHLGRISRYAVVVRDADTHQVFGVVQVGVQVEGQLEAMDALLKLLLILGPLSLVCATVGGYFLANRALGPARLAFERQQSFIADASHELRTPLALLRADADVLLRGRARFDPDDTLLLEDIVGETQHLTGIANNLLTLARLDSNAIHLERDVVDLATVATSAAHRIDALAKERGISVRLDALTSVAVIGDGQMLGQATLALLDNALKYAGSGSEITLTTSRKGDMGTLTVHDTGPGIAAEHLPQLGQRFYRPDKARSRAAGGAGLGLAVVRGILALHHGSLTLDSASGEGTTAIMLIPAISAASQPPPPTTSATAAADLRDEPEQRA
jgi:signal transduction histidine kinase